MKKNMAWLVLVFALNFGFVQTVHADEAGDLKQQLDALQAQVKNQAELIAAMQKKIEALGSAKVDSTPAESGVCSTSISDKVLALEERAQKPCETGLLGLKGGKWSFGGTLDFEYVNTKDYASMGEAEGHFQLNKFVFTPKACFTDDIYFYSEIEFYSSSMLTKYAFLNIDKLPYNTFLRAGLDQRFIKPSRKTERYPLAGNAFWRDNAAGLFAGGELAPLYWRASYTDGYVAGQRQIFQDDPVGNSLDMFRDGLKTSGYTSLGEFGTGLGYKYDFKKFGKVDALGFAYFSELSGVDVAYMNTNIGGGYSSTERDKYRYGASLDYSIFGANLFSQLVKSEDGDLDRLAWYIQPSYKIDLKKILEREDMKFFYEFEPVFRYGELYIENVDPRIASPLTWDRKEYTLGLATTVYKNIYLLTEYSIDRVDRGGADGSRDYGEFIAQAKVRF